MPPAPTLPKGLPLAQRLNGGTWLAPETSHALHVYIDTWEHYPVQAQAALDQLDTVLTTECAEARRVDAAQAAVSSDQRSASAEAHKMTFAKVLVPTSIGLAAGVILGIWLESKRKPVP